MATELADGKGHPGRSHVTAGRPQLQTDVQSTGLVKAAEPCHHLPVLFRTYE